MKENATKKKLQHHSHFDGSPYKDAAMLISRDATPCLFSSIFACVRPSTPLGRNNPTNVELPLKIKSRKVRLSWESNIFIFKYICYFLMLFQCENAAHVMN